MGGSVRPFSRGRPAQAACSREEHRTAMPSIRAFMLACALAPAVAHSAVAAEPANPYVSWYQDDYGTWHSDCTYWAWQRWLEVNGEALPSWGNAGEWAANAAAAGYPVSTH